MSLALHYPFYENASLTDIASGVALACTRATKRSMTDADGWIRTVQANEAAFPGTTFRHNVIINSQTFESWTQVNITSTDDATTDPFGGSNAASLVPAAGNAQHYIEETGIEVLKTNDDYLYSVYAKANGYNFVQLLNTNDATFYCNFNLSTGAVGNSGGTILDSGVEDTGNGWYRCWVAMTETGSESVVGYRIEPLDADTASRRPSWTANGSDGIYLYGAQLENVSGRWDSDNLLIQSATLDNAAWVKTNSAVTSGQSDPDGGTDAYLLEGSGGGTGQCRIRNSPSATTYPGQSYYVAVKAKASGLDHFSIRPAASSELITVTFDLGTGVPTATRDEITTGMTDLGDGWYLCWCEFRMDSSDNQAVIDIVLSTSTHEDTVVALTSASSVLLYQPQYLRKKPNETAPGTHIATTTAAVTNYSPGDYIATTTVAKSELSGANDGLVEWESRTNLILQSEDFSNSAWSVTSLNSAVGSNATIAPDGSITADKLIDDSGTGSGLVAIQTTASITFSTSTVYTMSCFCKADQLGWVRLRVYNLGAATTYESFFDLSNGVVGTLGADADSNGIKDYGNGWYRCWFTFTSDAVDTTGQGIIYVADGDGDSTVARDGTSSIFLWGAQLEAGSTPSPYTRTTTGTSTANADIISTTDTSWVGETLEHTFYFHGQSDEAQPSNPWYAFHLSNGAYTNRIGVYGSANDAGPAIANAIGDNWIPTITAFNNWSAGENRFAMGIAVDDGAFYTNGSQTATTTNVDPPAKSAYTRLDIGVTHVPQYHFNGLIKEFRYYDKRFDNQTIGDLSNGTFPLDDDFFLRRRKIGRMKYRHRYRRT